MKRSLLLLLSIVVLAFGFLIACNKDSDSTEPNPKEQKTEKKAKSDAKDDKKIDVYIDLKPKIKGGKVTIKGKTNLPNGTELLISLSNSDGFQAQSKTTVKGKKFKSETFTYKGEPLDAGEYTVDVTMPIAQVQSKDVQKVIGKQGENLTGALVEKSDVGGNTVAIKERLKVEGKAPNKNVTKEAKKHYDQLNALYEELQKEYEQHKGSMNDAAWGEFARGWKTEIETTRKEIEDSDYGERLKFTLGVAAGDLHSTFLGYVQDLQGRGNNKITKDTEENFREQMKEAKEMIK